MPAPVAANNFLLGVILLAAGASSRMGRPKMLLPWGTTSILGHLIAQWRTLGANQIAVVGAVGDKALEDELERVSFPAANQILNPNPGRGMFSSIQCAAQWTGWRADLTHWVVVLGDQPHLSPATLGVLIGFAATHSNEICLPFQGGHRRHPVVLPRTAFRRLERSNATDLKQFFESEQLALCELEDSGLELDLDRPEEYERALKRFAHTP